MGELIVPVLMMMVGIAFYVDSGKLPAEDDGLPMSSASYPEFLALLVMGCCAFLIIRFFIKRAEYMEAERKMPLDPRVLVVFALFVAFYAGLPVFGYIPCALVFLVILSLFFQKEKRRPLDTFILPACLSVGLYFAFNFMSIYLPTGSIFKGML